MIFTGLDGSEPRGEPDVEGGKDDLGADDEAESNARQQDGIEFHRQLLALMSGHPHPAIGSEHSRSNLSVTLSKLKEAGKPSWNRDGAAVHAHSLAGGFTQRE
jgi:hypothetical protein